MKKLTLALFLLLGGCFDLTQYISFNDQGRTVSSLRLTMPSSLLEVADGGDFVEKFGEVTNRLVLETVKDSNVTAETIAISNSASFGIESRRTAPKHYLASQPLEFFPFRESYGFSLSMGEGFKNSAEDKGSPDEMASAFFKYRILLSKASLPRPLQKVAIPSAQGEILAPVTDGGTFYLIEVPILPLFQGASKIEFHFLPAKAAK